MPPVQNHLWLSRLTYNLNAQIKQRNKHKVAVFWTQPCSKATVVIYLGKPNALHVTPGGAGSFWSQ